MIRMHRFFVRIVPLLRSKNGDISSNLHALLSTFSNSNIASIFATSEKDDPIDGTIIRPPDPQPENMSFFVEFVLERYEQKRVECEQLRKQVTMTSRDIEDKERDIQQLQANLKDLRKRYHDNQHSPLPPVCP